MKKQSITRTITRTDFRKVVNYNLNNRGKMTRFICFNAKMVIFEVVTNEGDMLFNPDSNFLFQSAIIKDGKIVSAFTFSVERLKYLVNTIDFFNRDEKSRTKMGFPEITLKNK